MIRKLRRKFIFIAMASLLLVLTAIIGSINAVNGYQVSKRADDILRILSDNDGSFPEMEEAAGGGEAELFPPPGYQITRESRYETRYFAVKANSEGIVIHMDTGHIAAVTPEAALEYMASVLKSGRRTGFHGVYKYLVSDKPYGLLAVFVDCRQQIQAALFLLLVSCLIALISLLVMFVLVSVFSRYAIQPVIDSIEKQKQFITDAGHEIKTPLAIISANTDVLELSAGKNEWIDSIRNQTGRLNDLVKQLLMLSRMEEEQTPTSFSDFSLSNAVWEAASPFQTLAETQGKELNLMIPPNIVMRGDEAAIRQLVSLLVDNAVKYAQDHGRIQVALSQNGKTIRLEVYNTVESIPGGDLDKLFGRFYRADSSRARETGGYGIGLSIAKAIVQTHKGKITVSPRDGGLAFTAVF